MASSDGAGGGADALGEGPARPDHATRTAHEPREDCVSSGRVIGVREETPTVRELTLQVDDPAFTFLPGNWVDFFIPGCPNIGGYSMCSVPSELPRLRLAVKRSAHPPAAWCHSEACIPGAAVQLRSGGTFAWDSTGKAEMEAGRLVLIAGGIGINPLYSIVQEALVASREELPNLREVCFLYSAARPSELAFRPHLEELARGDPRLKLQFTVTRNDGADKEAWDGATGRLTSSVLRSSLGQDISGQQVLAFVCGPPAMTDDVVRILTGELGMESTQVRFEKWW